MLNRARRKEKLYLEIGGVKRKCRLRKKERFTLGEQRDALL